MNMSGEFISGNFLNMPPREDRFDIVLIHDVIEHIEPEDKPAFFLGLKIPEARRNRVLRLPGLADAVRRPSADLP